MQNKHAAPALLFVAVVVAFVYYYCAAKYCFWPFDGMSSGQKGEFGDTFGAFTSIFSALGFGGVLATLWYQRESAALQSFETTVFGMLGIHSQIIQDMDIQTGAGGKVRYRGRDCFKRYYTGNLRYAYKAVASQQATALESEIVAQAFERMYEKSRQNLGHYFRFTYNIFRFIDEAGIERDAKVKYARIVRSQLSDYELLLLFYNCLHKNGVERFKPLVERYGIFNNLPVSLLFSSLHAGYYGPSAYESPSFDA